jgi:hypothetical protein
MGESSSAALETQHSAIYGVENICARMGSQYELSSRCMKHECEARSTIL